MNNDVIKTMAHFIKSKTISLKLCKSFLLLGQHHNLNRNTHMSLVLRQYFFSAVFLCYSYWYVSFFFVLDVFLGITKIVLRSFSINVFVQQFYSNCQWTKTQLTSMKSAAQGPSTWLTLTICDNMSVVNTAYLCALRWGESEI